MSHQHDHHKHDQHEHNHHELNHHEHNHNGHNHNGHDHHHADFKALFLKSLPLGLIIMILSPMMGLKLPFQFTFTYSDIIVVLLSTFLLIYGGKPFFEGALQEFKEKSPGMMALVSLGVLVSYLYSVYAVVLRYLQKVMVMDFFFEFASLILIMLLGHWIEMKAIGDAGDAQAALAKLIPKDIHLVLDNGDIEQHPITHLNLGDVVLVQAGENIPADGILVKGESLVNEAIFTGESRPIKKKVNDFVIGGTTNGDFAIHVQVSETGENSFIAQVQSLILQAQNQSSHAENLANTVARWLFYIAVGAAILAFVIWYTIADLHTAIQYMVTTLVIACPHALGLAIPLVVARSTSLGARRGLLVKNRKALEKAYQADVMVLDKTGTLTTGEFKVLDIDVIDDRYDEQEIISLLAGIEQGSSHPIAQSILKYAERKEIASTTFDSITVLPGKGIKGTLNQKEYQLISQKAYQGDLVIDQPLGTTLSILVEDDKVLAVVLLGDELKPTSLNFIKTLKSYSIKPIMATGDNQSSAQVVADQLNIEYHFDQSPQDKYHLISTLKDRNQITIMVGDGVNDAPSLALADVGIAIGAGTQVAIDSADVILTQSDLADIESFLELSVKTDRKMKENLVWGAGYNFLAIPVAAGILAPIGITLSPALGAILMSLSTVIVSINATRLKLEDKKRRNL